MARVQGRRNRGDFRLLHVHAHEREEVSGEQRGVESLVRADGREAGRALRADADGVQVDGEQAVRVGAGGLQDN